MKRHKLLFGLLLFMTTFNSHAALRVVTTTQDLAAIAEAVGGERVQVQSLTPGTRDPHYATAKPSMIRKVFRADLLLVIGSDMEIGWLPPLLQSARNSRVQPGNPGYLDLSSVIPLLGKINGPVSRAMGDVHAKGNPHYWLDPRNGIRMARAIATRLGELDPVHKDEFHHRFKAFVQTMDDKLPVWRSKLSHLRGQSVIAYHKSFVYLADAFGFRIVDEVEPIPGIAPSAASLNALITRIRNEHIGLLIMEPYYERRSARYLNEQTGIRTVVLPQSVGAQPGIHTYFDLFDAIVAALNNDGGK
ncbi:metal ABC transporter substrate-binding protein [Thiohalobacter sp. IOR34]|uniref:metal ABC transporter substrate-binding protein n=1 Tax=Thiohalobacter sp. IOR34 TaxID=3057176 RepID=UPI0025B15720|nr:metal ABC transporter substrate-binding protein [Thiohalobacter sp. IOR34]WJW74681.1 metal ABC transporter substrate-binding protein [Thiohalobacter sp. IOR34]